MWSVLNVTPNHGQADCHLLQMPDGAFALIDAADAWDAGGTAITLLKARKVDHLALVVISHFHQDHYGRLIDLLNAGIRIDRILLNVPSEESAALEKPWGCNWDHVNWVLTELRHRGIPFSTPVAGERYLEQKTANGAPVHLDVLCAYDGKTGPVGLTDVNDTSIVLRMSIGRTSALFTGDLNYRLGEYLAKSPAVTLSADLLKAPHHGTESTVPNEFYDRVGAKAVLISSPKSLWESARSKRTRDYFHDHNVPVFVTGLNGTITVRLRPDGYTVETER